MTLPNKILLALKDDQNLSSRELAERLGIIG
ncbi:winged helix-turn-helix transcriptional regulator [Pseudomonas sp. NPDC089408]